MSGASGAGRRRQMMIVSTLVVTFLCVALVLATVQLVQVTSRKMPSSNASTNTTTRRTNGSATSTPSSFAAGMGLTRTQTEELFHFIDGSRTVFNSATKVRGVPRVLGRDKRLFTIVEINGFPQVVDVQIVSVLDTSNKSTLENQVVYDSLACREFANMTAQKWCTSRILNTNSSGLVTATESRSFNGLRMMVRTFRSSNISSTPIVSLDFKAL